MSKTKTRAEYLLPTGVTPKKMQASADRILKTIRKQIGQISAAWGDIDGNVEYEALALLRAVDEFNDSVKNAVEFLREPMEGT